MKVMTVLGTRPEIIRLSRIVPTLDDMCDHVLVHTGQNFDRTLNELFFEELGLRCPDHMLESKADTAMEQIGAILRGCERTIEQEKPDRLLILGDTNSALSAIVAKRMGIPVYHMEAGNRCYDDRVPEELNRRIVDHSSDILLPYTERSRANLLREGIAGERIYVTGNPIYEVIDFYSSQIKASRALEKFGLSAGDFFLITLHRADNVDVPERLSHFFNAFRLLYEEYRIPLICSLHPRTRSQLMKQGIIMEESWFLGVEPLGFFDFVNLERQAKCVLTDSGTVQEESCIFNTPSVILRDVTERPETLEAGSTMLSGAEPESVLECVNWVLKHSRDWNPPQEYMVRNVADTVVKIVMGYYRR